MQQVEAPSLAQIDATRQLISPYLDITPVHRGSSSSLAAQWGDDTEVVFKLELLQRTGTFKARGALSVMLRLEPEELARGVVTVSAGNHAIAVAYAAQVVGTSAHVVMPRTASPLRIRKAQAYGAVVELVQDVHAAFERVREIQDASGRTFVHPFEGLGTTLGTATLGLEFQEQAPGLDALIVPIGGGGLCSGIAAAFNLVAPRCTVFGVEPQGANVMQRSLRAGQPETMAEVRTIADSLAPPRTGQYSFELCRRFVQEIVTVSDTELRKTMMLLLEELHLAVEPAAAAATAALLGPLRERLRGVRVGVIVCGTNIDTACFCELVMADRS